MKQVISGFCLSLLFLGILLPHVFAAADPPSTAQTSSLPTGAKTVKGDTLFANVDVGEVYESPLNQFDLFLQGTINLLGQVKLEKDQIKYPSMSRFAETIKNATMTKLSPLFIQERTEDAATPENVALYPRYSQKSARHCVQNKEGTLINDVVSETTMQTESKNPEKTIELEEGSRIGAAMYARGEVIPTPVDTDEKMVYDYRRDPLTIDKDNPLPCDAPFTTAGITTKENKNNGTLEFFSGSIQTTGDMVREGDPVPRYTSILNALGEVVQHLLGFFGIYPNTVIAKITTLDPYAAQSFCNLHGCKPEDISRVNYPVESETVHSGGLANTFKPEAHEFVKNNAYDGGADKVKTGTNTPAGELQGFTSNAGTQKKPTALPYAQANYNAALYTFCSVLPLEKQQTQFPNGECEEDWKKQ